MKESMCVGFIFDYVLEHTHTNTDAHTICIVNLISSNFSNRMSSLFWPSHQSKASLFGVYSTCSNLNGLNKHFT